MLQLGLAADEPWLWDLRDLAPTPAHAALLSEEQVQRVLKAHRIRRVKATEVLACLQAPALPVAPGVLEAAQAHCGFLLPCLRVLAEQLRVALVGFQGRGCPDGIQQDFCPCLLLEAIIFQWP
jgi:hypothetical protein